MQVTNRKAYRTVAIPMTLTDLQGHTPNAGLLKCDISCICAAADKISTDLPRRAVTMRY